MSKPTVEVRIDKKGEVHIDVSGVSGTECEMLTKAIIDALGGDVKEVQHKPEFYVELDGIQQYVTEE